MIFANKYNNNYQAKMCFSGSRLKFWLSWFILINLRKKRKYSALLGAVNKAGAVFLFGACFSWLKNTIVYVNICIKDVIG